MSSCFQVLDRPVSTLHLGLLRDFFAEITSLTLWSAVFTPTRVRLYSSPNTVTASRSRRW